MEIAMNKRASYALLAGATGVFYTHTFAGGENGDVAMQDLTLNSEAEENRQCRERHWRLNLLKHIKLPASRRTILGPKCGMS